MTKHARSEFPLRPFPNEGESIAGYLFRLHMANGHKLTAELLTTINTLYSADSLDELERAYSELQLILGPELGSHLDQNTWTHERFFQSVAPLWHQWYLDIDHRFRACPLCFAQYGYHLLIWELSHVTVCPVHRIRLIGCCTDCSRVFSWQTLRRDWACMCGCTITEMHAPSVTGIGSAISAILCNSSDVSRPPDYPLDLLRPIVGDPIQLQYAYLRLYDLELLRAFIIRLAADDYYSAWRTSDHASRYVRRPKRWTARLLFEWPTGFQRTLLRLAKFHYRASKCTLVQFAPLSRELAVVDFLCAIEEYSWIDAPIRHATLQLLKSIQAPLPFRSLVIYSPALTLSERNSRLSNFSRWWNSQCKQWRTNAGSNHALTKQYLAYPNLDQSREERIINILNAFISAATANLGTEESTELMECWPVSPPDNNEDDPESLLRTLVQQLTLATNQQIEDIEITVWQFDEEFSE